MKKLPKTIKDHKSFRPKGIVTERDLLILKWLCEQGAMTVNQIWRAVWGANSTIDSKQTYVRTGILQGLSLIEKVEKKRANRADRISHFRATKNGRNCLLESEHGQGVVPIKNAPSNQWKHIDTLTELRLAVLKSGNLASWVTDRMLEIDPSFPKHRFRLTVPDAIWTSKKTGKRVAIEFERTRKSRSRVRSKLALYGQELSRTNPLFDLVIWIVESESYDDYELYITHYPRQQLWTLKEFLLSCVQDSKST